jgi:hypothetical protein
LTVFKLKLCLLHCTIGVNIGLSRHWVNLLLCTATILAVFLMPCITTLLLKFFDTYPFFSGRLDPGGERIADLFGSSQVQIRLTGWNQIPPPGGLVYDARPGTERGRRV